MRAERDVAQPRRNRYYFLIDEEGKLIWKNTSGGLIPADKLLTDFAELIGGN